MLDLSDQSDLFSSQGLGSEVDLIFSESLPSLGEEFSSLNLTEGFSSAAGDFVQFPKPSTVQSSSFPPSLRILFTASSSFNV